MFSADTSDTEYRIAVPLDFDDPNPAEYDSDDDEEPSTPTLLLHVTYPDEYPDVAPILDISADGDLGRYLELPDDSAQLLSSLDSTIEESLGMAMVFALHSTLKDAAESLIAERIATLRAAEEERIAEQEKIENAKFHGTMVNRETFLAWRDEFQKEISVGKEKKREDLLGGEGRKDKLARERGEGKATGRELWETGVAKGGDYDEGEDDVAAVEGGVEKLSVKA
jgi:RWD domain